MSRGKADVASRFGLRQLRPSASVVQHTVVVASERIQSTSFVTPWFTNVECARHDLFWRVCVWRKSRFYERFRSIVIQAGSRSHVQELQDTFHDLSPVMPAHDTGVDLECAIASVGGAVSSRLFKYDHCRIVTGKWYFLLSDILTRNIDTTSGITTIAVYIDISPSHQKVSHAIDFITALRDNLFCDVTLKVHSTEFKAHGVVLSRASPLFKAMFESECWEENEVVVIDEVREAVLRLALRFIYSWVIDTEELFLLGELLVFANRYQIGELFEECVAILKKDTTSDLLELLLIADTASSPDLKQHILHRIKLHPKKKDLFSDVSLSKILETRPLLLVELLQL